ncbi:arginine--tRNA ligase [Pollutibacter soli]|uniref:arginine--tRNA ligase n=1 Tax=Pollutibacter soli TaxID=3034157 RepID=UPI003013D717
MIGAIVKEKVVSALEGLFNMAFTEKDFQVNQTKPEFEGDYTVVLFSLVKSLKLSPDELGNKLGSELIKRSPELFTGFNIIKGFLNLTIAESFWLDLLKENYQKEEYGKHAPNGVKVMVEYSSPNTNKPLHLGHLRNNFLGWSIAEILKASGNEVIKSCIVNDRGIHICKSMLAWKLFSNGATPESTNQKGDHFVGDYYVKFNDAYKLEVDALVAAGQSKADAEKNAPIMQATQEMLKKWEEGDPETIQLWKMMNSWVYAGFDETYKKIGSDFNRTYYESETYLLGKDTVQDGLEKGVFFRKDDGSVWIDLTADGLDEKLVLRKDGTSVYITQDIGLAQDKYKEYGIDKSIYVIGDEQNYHMKVLKLICQKIGLPYADSIYHLSYGMVELPTGKMKSREGTVVDADDIVAEMNAIAAKHTAELGKVQDFAPEALNELYDTIGLGALKFFLLRVDPKKKMVFNPEESVDFHGFTGPFIQYTHARIKSILRKEKIDPAFEGIDSDKLFPLEKSLLVSLEQYEDIIAQAASELNPSVIAIYAFNLAKTFNSFYAEHSVMQAETESKKQLRLRIAAMTALVLSSSMKLLGIRVPERM